MRRGQVTEGFIRRPKKFRFYRVSEGASEDFKVRGWLVLAFPRVLDIINIM